MDRRRECRCGSGCFRERERERESPVEDTMMGKVGAKLWE
jgi:hypothetical protein